MGRKKKVEFDYKIMIKKGIKAFILFSLPILVDKFIIDYPELAQISLGSCLSMLANYVKIKAQT